MKKSWIAASIVFATALFIFIISATSVGGALVLWGARRLVLPSLHASLSYDDAQFSLFKSLSMKNVKVKWQGPNSQMLDATIDSLSVSYRSQLFPLRVNIDEFIIQSPKIRMVLLLALEKQADSSFNPQEFLKKLENQKSSFNVRNIKIQNASGDLDVTMGDRGARLNFVDLNFEGDGEMSRGLIQVNAKTDVGATKPLGVKSFTPAANLETELDGALALSLRFFREDAWKLNLSTGSSHMQLTNTQITLNDPLNPESSGRNLKVRAINLSLGSMVKLSPESFCVHPESQDFRMRAAVEITPMELFSKTGKSLLKISAHKWEFGSAKGKDILLTGNLGVNGLTVQGSGLKTPVPVDTDWKFQMKEKCEFLFLTGGLNLYNANLLGAELTVKKDEKFRVAGRGHLDIPLTIARLFSELPWRRVGLWSGKWTLDGSMDSAKEDANDTAKVQPERVGIFDLRLNQNFALGRSADALGVGAVSMHVEAKPNNKIIGRAEVSQLMTSVLKKPISLATTFDLDSKALQGSPDTQGKIQVLLNGETVATTDLIYDPSHVKVNSKIIVHAFTNLILDAAKQKQAGELNLDLSVAGDPSQKIVIDGILTRQASDDVLPVKIEGPIKFNVVIHDVHVPKRASLKVGLPGIVMPKYVNWGPLVGAFEFAPIGETTALSITGEFEKNQMILYPKDKPAMNLTGLEGELAVVIDERSIPQVNKMEFKVASGAVSLKAHSTKDASGRVTLEGEVATEVPPSWPEFNGGSISGASRLNFVVSQQRNQIVTVDGQMNFNKFNASMGPIRVLGINGAVPFSEILRLKENNNVEFASINTMNPFAFADFENFQPITPRFRKFSIDKIHFYKKSYGPYDSFVSIQQNFVENRGIGFEVPGGFIVADLILDLNPDARSMGFLTRMSGIRMSELMPDEMSRGVKFSSEPMSGRAGLVLSVNKKELNGRFDITQIGSSQLISMINYVDPNYENDKLAAARTGLGIAYPTMVQGRMQNGYMDLSMALGGLAPARYDVPSIPMAALVVSTFDRFGIE